MLTVILYTFVFLAAGSALSILFVKNVFKAALLLLISLLALAAIYVMAFAEFVAVTQILIYAGGILVVILFGIMLTSRMSGKPLVVSNGNVIAGVSVGVALFALFTAFLKTQFAAMIIKPVAEKDRIAETGISIMSDFLLPFEVVGLLLLVALIGAAVVTSSTRTKKM